MRFSFFPSFVVASALACGGQTTTPTDGGADVVSDSANDTSSDGSPTFSGTPFAVKRLYLGEADRSGIIGPFAWKNYGTNIDGLLTTSTSTDVCTLAAGAPKGVQVDGNAGIDNSWGASILPIFQTISSQPTPSVTATNAIQTGLTTLLIAVTGLSNDPQQTASGLGAVIVAGATYPGTPAFDSSTSWPTLSGVTPTSFTGSVTSGNVVMKSADALVVELPLSPSITMKLTVHVPVVSFMHVDPNDVTDGTISGVLDPNELVAAFDAIAGELSTALCGNASAGVDDQMRQAVDILIDGTNHANASCNGISIGLGFDAVAVAPPATSGSLLSPPNPCP